MYAIKLKTLTPLWTGDAKRRGFTLRETGIIGSLRWWYEALIRGLGGVACDPTDTNKSCESLKRCNVCEFFGCGGWSRKFKLEINAEIEDWEFFQIGARKNMGARRSVSGVITKSGGLIFTPLKDIPLSQWQLLRETLQIITDYGAIGGRVAQGNGVINITENNLPEWNGKIYLKKAGTDNINAQNRPKLSDFFFRKYRLVFTKEIAELIKDEVFWTHAGEVSNFKDNWDKWEKTWNDFGILPIAFHVRDTLRRRIVNKDVRHSLWGKLGEGSKIFVSHGYKTDARDNVIEFRVFGYGVSDSGQSPQNPNSICYGIDDELPKKLFLSATEKYIEKIECSNAITGGQIIDGLKNRLEVSIENGS